jgi:hypothetical protein
MFGPDCDARLPALFVLGRQLRSVIVHMNQRDVMMVAFRA